MKPSIHPIQRWFAAYATLATAIALGTAAKADAATPVFHATTDAASWLVATHVGGADGALSSFPTAGFVTAVQTPARVTDGVTWIANNSTGTNGGIGTWTFFVFRQTIDLTGFDPATADLKFQWAADDSGEGFAARGSWTPKFRVNGGALINGSWPGTATYSFGNVTDIHSGFVAGINTLDFYVEGNGVTDGFALKPLGLTVAAIPEPASFALLAAGLGVIVATTRRRRAAAA
jgi:hypothetical protein